MVVERLDFAKRQGGEPQTVRLVRQGEANAVFWRRKPLFQGRGGAWREQGLDCLSAASYQARRQATRDKESSAPGVAFFADFLWRGKESQRGALPLSATASKRVPWMKVSAQAVAILVF